MRTKDRLHKIEQQLQCRHRWEANKSYFLGLPYYERICSSCELSQAITAKEYIEFLKNEIDVIEKLYCKASKKQSA
jgi:hypothetical protein